MYRAIDWEPLSSHACQGQSHCVMDNPALIHLAVTMGTLPGLRSKCICVSVYMCVCVYVCLWGESCGFAGVCYWITLCSRRHCFCCSQIWRTRHRHIVIFTRSNLMDSKGCQPFKKHICHVLKPFYGQINIEKIARSRVSFRHLSGRFCNVAIRQWPLTPASAQRIYGVILWAVMAPI